MTKRRTKGDGALFRRASDGRWVGRFVVPLPDGRRTTKSVYGRTQKEARIKLAHAIRERDQGTLVLTSTTVAAWLDYWIEHIAARRIRPQTMAGYQSKIETLIRPHLGHHRLGTLRPEHIRAWLDLLRDHGGKGGKPLAEASVRQAYAILRRALKDAVNDGKIASNPAERVDPPGTATEDRRALTLADATNVLRAAGDDPRWWLAVFYGFRQGEALGLRWGDVDFDANEIHVRQSLQIGPDRKVIFGPPKTRKSQRTIPMHDHIRRRLALHKPSGVDDNELVFPGPVMPWVDSRAWHALLEAAGAPSLPLHSARHTAASVLAAAGVDPDVRAAILGHSQVKTTHDYTHTERRQIGEAFDAASDMLALE